MLFLDKIMLLFLSFPYIYIQIPFLQCLLKGLIQEYPPRPKIIKTQSNPPGQLHETNL